MPLLASALVAGVAHGATSTIGRTWPIAEPDALVEIEARVATLPKDLAPKFGPRARWSAMKSATLAPVTTARTRTVIPFYTLDMDVPLPDGRVLYPQGLHLQSARLCVALAAAADRPCPRAWPGAQGSDTHGLDPACCRERRCRRPDRALEEHITSGQQVAKSVALFSAPSVILPAAWKRRPGPARRPKTENSDQAHA